MCLLFRPSKNAVAGGDFFGSMIFVPSNACANAVSLIGHVTAAAHCAGLFRTPLAGRCSIRECAFGAEKDGETEENILAMRSYESTPKAIQDPAGLTNVSLFMLGGSFWSFGKKTGQ